MRVPTRIDAIQSLVPDSVFSLNGDNTTWIDPPTAPVTEEQIVTEFARLQQEYEDNEYQRLRAQEYPSIADQLDTLYHGGLDAWKAQIKTVKDKYPK